MIAAGFFVSFVQDEDEPNKIEDVVKVTVTA